MADATTQTQTPANGAKPNGTQTPAPGTTTPTPPPDATAAELREWKTKAEHFEAEAARARKDEIINRRAADAKVKSFGDKLKDADELARLRRLSKVNKAEAARILFGETWHEDLNTVQANGNMPTAASIDMGLQEAEERGAQRAISEFEKRQRAQQEASEKAENARHQAALQQFAAQALGFAKENAKDYPFAATRYEGEQNFGGAVARRIRDTHEATVKRDESGAIIQPGRMLSFKEAADQIEAEEKKLDEARNGLRSPKPSGSLSTVKPSQSQPLPSTQSQSQGRRTLSHDLTGRTPGEPSKYRSDEERKQAALQRYEESRSK